MEYDFEWHCLGGVYLGGHPQSAPHLHLTADPTAWTRHPLHLHLTLLDIYNTVVPTYTDALDEIMEDWTKI